MNNENNGYPILTEVVLPEHNLPKVKLPVDENIQDILNKSNALDKFRPYNSNTH